MSKSLYIAEKPSVAQEFARALDISGSRRDGWLESENSVVTWCVGHLVTMSYPEKYDEKYRRWSFETLPFLPEEFKYEVISSARRQYEVVKKLLNRPDIDTIYVCTDSGREGEYIYRLVAMMAGVKDKTQKRVWIDSQTEEEILRGIREAKDISEYDHLSDSAYLRAKEDYLMGINFSRALTLRYGGSVSQFLGTKYQAISVGRVMTCVLGMVVRREREIRSFVKTPFYRVLSHIRIDETAFDGEWRASAGSRYENSPKLYKENGFKKKEDAMELVRFLTESESGLPLSGTGETGHGLSKDGESPLMCRVRKVERKKETKKPPMLFNLAELQNVCSKLFKISPDETLKIVQELYEKKLVTYPRTDAHVLSSAVAKEIYKNINGLKAYDKAGEAAVEVLGMGTYKTIAKTRYVNDSQITDHYAIIPTGQGLSALKSVSQTAARVYETIVRRFLCIFYPPAVYQKVSLVTEIKEESFFSSFKVLVEEGYLKVAANSFARKKRWGLDGRDNKSSEDSAGRDEEAKKDDTEDVVCDASLVDRLSGLKKGDILAVNGLEIKEGETTPPSRYNSGSMILAMENAGQLIEDEELRSQIKGAGIGTSATRAEILKKLFNIHYLALNKKTQIITPTLLGEMIFDVVNSSIRSLLNPELTASWEKGLNYVAEGSITSEEYMVKLNRFVTLWTEQVRSGDNRAGLRKCFEAAAPYYVKTGKRKKTE